MTADHTPGGRVLSGITHGGHPVQRQVPTAAEPVADTTTAFDYLFTELEKEADAHLPVQETVVAALEALGAAMVEDPPAAVDPMQAAVNSTIPTVYTYFGQFVDHDLTANTDRNSAVSDITVDGLSPLGPDFVVANLRNLRQPALNLDSVYGDGPTFPGQPATQAAGFYDGPKLRVGEVAQTAKPGAPALLGVPVPPAADLARDLPRVAGKAQIGDGRNDENLIIAQLHTAFLRFHNAAVDWVLANEPDRQGDPAVFARAQQLTRWHYQWLVAHDFLQTIALPGVADQILLGGNTHYEPRNGQVWMPLEFSVAAYRFGHSMVRAVYDYNRNFGRPGPSSPGLALNVPNLPNAPFGLLFAFTGNHAPPFFGATDVLPFNWVIEWDRFVHKGSRLSDQFARRIDTRLAPPLRDLTNEGAGATPPVALILKRLAVRNLLRGYLLSIPTGQAAADAMGVPALTAQELQQDNNPVVNDALAAGGFLTRTPLWYYVLKEAEVRANGNSLGELGSRIVCETIIGQIRFDADSYLNAPGGWSPDQGVRLANGDLVVTIADLLRFAGVLT